MTLETDIIDMVQGIILGDLAAPKVPRKRLPKLKKIWKCESPHDFLYGHRVGYYKGIAEGITIARQGRQLLPDEDNQIFELTNSYAKMLRTYFAYYKNQESRGNRSAKQKRAVHKS